MINELIKLATHLDKKGLIKEADYLDQIIKHASVTSTWIKRTWGYPRNPLATDEGKKAYSALNAFNTIFAKHSRMLHRSLKQIDASLSGLNTETQMSDRRESMEERNQRRVDRRDARGQWGLNMPGANALKAGIANLLGQTTEALEADQKSKVLTEALLSAGPKFPAWFHALSLGTSLLFPSGKALEIWKPKDIEDVRKGLGNAKNLTEQIYNSFPEDSTVMRGRFSSSDIRVAALAVNTAAKQALAAINAWVATAAPAAQGAGTSPEQTSAQGS